MKRLGRLLLLSSLAALTFLLMPLALALAPPPIVTAQSAILVEASTGRVLFEKNADRTMYPASLTKIMTSAIALESAKSDSVVMAPAAVAYTESTRLEPGDRLTMDDMLKAMMLISDNGAAVAVAEYIAGSVPAFAEMMTKKAHEVGAANTVFKNPHGLPDEGHVSTARDLVTIARYCWRLPGFRRLSSSREATVYFLSPPGRSEYLSNSNLLLFDYPGMTGIKTGWTQAAGGCLAGAAERDGVTLMGIVLKAPDAETRFSDMRAMMDYGFTRVRTVNGPSREDNIREIAVRGGMKYKITARPRSDIRYVLIDDDSERNYSVRVDIPKSVTAPVATGAKVGDLIIRHGEKDVTKIDMIADFGAREGFSLIGKLMELCDALFSPIFG